MASPRFRNSPFKYIIALLALSLFMDGCSCQDEGEYIWLFDEYDEFDAGTEPDAEELPIDWDWAFPDPDLDPDPPDWEETEWQTEVIEDSIPRTFAHNDRTSVVVDRDGTVWLGYHRCDDAQCSAPMLVIGHRLLNETEWVWESIEHHTGLFALQVIEAGKPVVVYLDAGAGQLKAAIRESPGRWLIEALPVTEVAGSDGFDISRDRARYYVSHASHSRQRIEFFTYNTASTSPYWRSLQPMESARSAAYERGLRGGNQLNFYLVHRDHRDQYRLSEYDLGADEWTRSTDTYPAAISSFLVRQNGELCTVGPSISDLLFTCGSFNNPLRDQAMLHGGAVYYLSSLIEGRDETLYVAYHEENNQDLYVARRPQHQSWSTERVHLGQTFGISTAVDHRDHILMSFYHCDTLYCSVHLMERSP